MSKHDVLERLDVEIGIDGKLLGREAQIFDHPIF
jgi:hypothetical protein